MSGRRAKALRRQARAIDPIHWADLYALLKKDWKRR